MSSASADVDAVPDLKAQIVTGDKDGNSPISAEIPDEVIIFKYRDKFFISKKIDKPWYRNLSILISAAAFFTSVATSMITAYTSYQQEKSQDLNAKRQSIQQLVGQYYATALVDNVNQFNFFKDVAPVTNCLQLAEPYKSVCNRDSNRSDTETQGVYSLNIMLGSISRILANEIDENISSNELIQT